MLYLEGNMCNYITSLIKFTDHPEDFINGKLYCNTWEYFNKLKKKGVGDSNEMTQAILATEYENKILNKRYSFHFVNNDNLHTPVFCMYSYSSKKYKHPLIIKLPKIILKDIGSYKHAVIITNVKKFLNRIEKEQPSFCYRPIEYISFDNCRGKAIVEPITKKDKYDHEHQQEFRIYDHSIAITRKKDFNVPGTKKISGFYNNGNLAAKFFIGNLSDITKTHTPSELFDGIRIELDIDWDYCQKNNLVKKRQLIKNKIMK